MHNCTILCLEHCTNNTVVGRFSHLMGHQVPLLVAGKLVQR